MCNYIIRPRQNHTDTATDPATKTLFAASARKLHANNAAARINFAQTALRQVLAHEGIAAGPLHLVTITPARCACAINDGGPGTRQMRAARRHRSPAAAFDVVTLQQIARQGMGEIPFLGMIEAALFSKWGPDGWSFTDSVSWHCHLLTWGKTNEEVSAQVAPLRRRHRSMFERVSAVHIKSVAYADVPRQLLYILKAPQKVSRVGHFSRRRASSYAKKTKPSAMHIQKDWLRTGQRIRMLDIMGERRLDQLLFGNSAGTALARIIRAQASRCAGSEQRRPVGAVHDRLA
ncbi:hypothetical protein [Methylobacterium sp. GC_Met_2]|uniref:hypothetical protein n=1 Tax=Methylobacterium sp. GC_Met_2 TaxID=2937376 RepID=UPI00226B473A|nr:hypothetical protein [Methylobacterium sp. GC_Met_2]